MGQNVWFASIYDNWEGPVIEHFKKEGLWDNVVWPSTDNPDKTYLDTSFHNNLDFPEFSNIEPELYEKLYGYLPTFVDMYSRNSPWGQNVYDQKNYHDYVNLFNLIINYYHYHYKKYKIDLLITPRAPHVGHDFLRCMIAKEMGIKTLFLEQSQFPNRFFYYWDHYDYGSFNSSKELFPQLEVGIPRTFEKDLFYIKKIPSKTTLKESIKKLITNPQISLLRELAKSFDRQQALYRYNLKKEYSKNHKKIASKDINWNIPFVYFPLHLQPEKTTSSWGGMFTDQLLAIERLSMIIPENWQILVKENPKQTFFMRGKFFYQRLQLIKKVKVVPHDTNTYDLLRKCQFASTITGTVGWEAITGGKNVLVFGWGVWYKTLPGVFSYSPEIKVETIKNNIIDHEELERKFAKLSSKMGEGVIYKGGYKNLVKDFSLNENVNTIISSLKKILYTPNKK